MSLKGVVVLAAFFAALAVAGPQMAPGLVNLVRSTAEEPAPPPRVVVRAPEPSRDVDPGRTSRLAGRRVALAADRQGHYRAEATINGRRIEMIVDTGATTVALNAATARRLGLFVPTAAYTARISTANGTVSAAPIRLAEVRLGAVSVRDVPAVVVPGELLPANLLGMSFLSRLSKFEAAAGRLVLVQ